MINWIKMMKMVLMKMKRNKKKSLDLKLMEYM